MYALQHHKQLSPEKWSRYSRGQQILMIGNELNRAKNLLKQNDMDNVLHCYERGFELIDLTSADEKWRGRIKELRRMREVLAEMYVGQDNLEEKNRALYVALMEMNSEAYNLVGTAY